jgi:hypothetical protein
MGKTRARAGRSPTRGLGREDRQPFDPQPLHDLLAVAEHARSRQTERIEHVDRRGDFVIGPRLSGAGQRDAQLLAGFVDPAEP